LLVGRPPRSRRFLLAASSVVARASSIDLVDAPRNATTSCLVPPSLVVLLALSSPVSVGAHSQPPARRQKFGQMTRAVVCSDKRNDWRAARTAAPTASVARGEDDECDRVDGSDARVRGVDGDVGGDVLERMRAWRKFEGAVARAAKRRRENDSRRRQTSLGN
jgi:hypothetical protein